MQRNVARKILAENIRRAAEAAGGLEQLRSRTRLSTGTFYELLGMARREPTLATLRKLHRAKVSVPKEFLLLG